jgi:NTE family protein
MSEQTIGLALGAGGARGIAHVHVLRALDDLGLKSTAIAGTSIGAILGAAYGSGLTGNEIRTMLLELFGDRQAIITSLWSLRARDLSDWTGSGRPRFGELNLERILQRLLPTSLPDNIEDLKIDTQILATDYYGHQDAIFAHGPLLPAMAASAAMPAVFQPVTIDGVVLIDGGATNPVPIDLLQEKASFIIGVDVSGGPEGEPGTLPSMVDALYAANQLMQRTIISEKAKRMRCDVLMRPKVGSWQVLDFMRTDKVLKATEPLCEEVKVAVAMAMEKAEKTVG